jgi:hypothetical protein
MAADVVPAGRLRKPVGGSRHGWYLCSSRRALMALKGKKPEEVPVLFNRIGIREKP